MEQKTFQAEALRRLRGFLEEARFAGKLEEAFGNWRKPADEGAGLFVGYRPLAGLPETPYCCLRLPTGGGKTVLGAYAVGVVAEAWLQKRYPLVLWLVPSDAIRAQTVAALAQPDHFYRKALGEAFSGQVRVLDVQSFTQLRPQDLRANACVVVATMASLRVERTEGRKVYAHHEELEGHFTAEAKATPGLERVEPGRMGAGGPKFSFANLLKVHGPVVIVDEAHQFMTDLSDKVLGRIGASMVLDLTATPDARTNVLYRATARELEDAEMIKLPVVLQEHTNGWQNALCEAVETRKSLQRAAEGEADYIRPILLVQAQNAGQDAEVAAVRAYLLDNGLVRPEELAVHTGKQRDLTGKDLRARTCPITTVITVKALVEGWDCPFAYVLCSTANLHSPKDVEQLLGRVLRMPYAAKRKAAEMNKAYAYVTSQEFGKTALLLKDSLVGLGFEPDEGRRAIEQNGKLPLAPVEIDRPRMELAVEAAPDFALLPPEERGDVFVRTGAEGMAVRVEGFVSAVATERILAVVPEEKRAQTRERLRQHNAACAPSERGERFPVPQLVTDVNGQKEIWSDEALADWLDWSLLEYRPALERLQFDENTRLYTLNLHEERFVLAPLTDKAGQLELLGVEGDKLELVKWLDWRMRDNGIGQRERVPWLLRSVEETLAKPGFSMEVLERGKFVLLKLLRAEMERARYEATSKGFTELLGPGMRVVTDVSGEVPFEFKPEYTPSSRCTGYKFDKHYYPGGPGEMKGSGEEFRCAQELDRMKEVQYWVRNLAGRHRRETSFWLQTRTDKFYPDFVAQMIDGRTFVVEYKGEDYVTNDDSEEKDALGKLWAGRGNGKQIFAMVWEGRQRPPIGEQLRRALLLSS